MKKEYKGLIILTESISFEDVLSASDPDFKFGDFGDGMKHGDFSELLG